MKKLIAVLLIAVIAVFSVSGCEPIGREDPVEPYEPIEPVPYVVECTEGPELLIFYDTGEPYQPVYTAVKSEDSEEFIWNELSKWSPNDQITAGVMGYFWKESFMRSDAVAGWDVRNYFYGQDMDICEEFTQKVDAGLKAGSTRDYFIEMVQIHYGGYGLGQWLMTDYLNDLYDFVRERDGSIGDAKLQCEFIFQSLQKNARLWNLLMGCKTAEQCGRRIGTLYDGCDESGAEMISSAAKQYYKKFHEEEKT